MHVEAFHEASKETRQTIGFTLAQAAEKVQ